MILSQGKCKENPKTKKFFMKNIEKYVQEDEYQPLSFLSNVKTPGCDV